MFETGDLFHCKGKGQETGWNMFGVVLWSDEQEQKAVIWCEDHGDLAFYSNTGDDFRHALDAGDWVQFDMTMERHQRFAHNPRLVCEGVYPDLANALCAVSTPSTTQEPVQERPVSARSDRSSAQIIPFQSAPVKRRKAPDRTHVFQA